ncbi:MAG: adenylate/guanylate cyclase domain-containing protein [Planctomycetota bacterium]|jgi:adenylate cyclase
MGRSESAPAAWLDYNVDGKLARIDMEPGVPVLLGRCPESPIDCKDDRLISRRHCQIDLSPPHCWLTNLGPNGTRVNGTDVSEYRLHDGDIIEIGSSVLITARVRDASAAAVGGTSHDLHTLGSSPHVIPLPPDSVSLLPEAAPDGSVARDAMLPLMRGVGRVMDVLQTAMSSHDFFQRAAQAVVDLVGLDSGRVVLLDRTLWRPEATAFAGHVHPEAVPPISRSVLEMVRLHSQVFWETGGVQATDSIANLEAVVAAPILDENNTVIGAVYGDRTIRSPDESKQIGEWEAMLIELLACTVASGLQRLRQQEQVASLRSQFEQFFTRELAQQLEQDPTLLEGHDATVTTLFCDVRSFSAICEHLGTQRTFDWINDVMGVLSECVREFDGVLVDYIGDELMAMWGAPLEQADHAQLACQTALRMFERLPEIDSRWQTVVGQPTKVGVGINTGPVRVGNTGSKLKFKYGPLGHSVNLASRVQGATKYLMSPLLITGATRDLLGDEFDGRRLCDIRVVNVREPVAIYEIRPDATAEHSALLSPYEQALGHFEKAEYREAAALLTRTLTDCPDDGPSLLLLSRVVNAMTSNSPTDPVWELPGK